jgi:ComF family protein
MLIYFIKKIIKFVYQPCCVLCKKNTKDYDSLCIDCFLKVFNKYNNHSVCYKCGKMLEIKPESVSDSLCGKCVNSKYYFEKIYFTTYYNSYVSKLLSMYKFEDKFFLYKFFTKVLTIESLNINEKIDVITIVPMNYFKIIKRNYHQLYFIAKNIRKYFLNAKMYTDLLKAKYTKYNQVELSLNKRIKNAKKKFYINGNNTHLIKDKNILIIEDVITTGSSINRCAELLIKNGAKKVIILAITRVEGELKI